MNGVSMPETTSVEESLSTRFGVQSYVENFIIYILVGLALGLLYKYNNNIHDTLKLGGVSWALSNEDISNFLGESIALKTFMCLAAAGITLGIFDDLSKGMISFRAGRYSLKKCYEAILRSTIGTGSIMAGIMTGLLITIHTPIIAFVTGIIFYATFLVGSIFSGFLHYTPWYMKGLTIIFVITSLVILYLDSVYLFAFAALLVVAVIIRWCNDLLAHNSVGLHKR